MYSGHYERKNRIVVVMMISNVLVRTSELKWVTKSFRSSFVSDHLLTESMLGTRTDLVTHFDTLNQF